MPIAEIDSFWSHAVTAVVSASVIGAVFKGVAVIKKVGLDGAKADRDARSADKDREIKAFQQQIEDLRQEVQGNRAYYDEKIEEKDRAVARLMNRLNDSVSDHSACLMKVGFLRKEVKRLMRKQGAGDDEIALFDSDYDRLGRDKPGG